MDSRETLSYKSFLDKKWVVQKMLHKFAISKTGNFINYDIDDFDKDSNAPTYSDQIDILEKMDAGKNIKIHGATFKKHFSRGDDDDRKNYFKIELPKTGFDEFIENLSRLEKTFRIESDAYLEPEISVAGLSFFLDGTLKFRNGIIELPAEIRELCVLFMKHEGEILNEDDIKAVIIHAKKRPFLGKKTISKYVSKLRSSLKVHFGKNVIINQRKSGWSFRP